MTAKLFQLHARHAGAIAGLLDRFPDDWTGSRQREPHFVVEVTECGPSLEAALNDLGAKALDVAELGERIAENVVDQHAQDFRAPRPSLEHQGAWILAYVLAAYEAGLLGLDQQQAAELTERTVAAVREMDATTDE